MSSHIQFETPENIELSYRLAGLGTRFIGWFIDSILLVIIAFFTFILLYIAGVATGRVFQELSPPTDGSSPDPFDEINYYFVGLFVLVFGLSSFVYYGLFELLMRGQTPGKRYVGVRVVKADGFSLDPACILVRNIFRIADQIPALWIVPVVSKNSQRLGDMVAGTLVVVDQPKTMNSLRDVLLSRPQAECRFRFDAPALKRIRAVDVEAIETLLQRYDSLGPDVRFDLINQVVEPLAKRLVVDVPPDEESRVRFVEDLLAAEYRRQYRKLS